MKRYSLLTLPLVMMLSGCFFAIYPNKFDTTVQLPRFNEGTDTHIGRLIETDGYYAGAPDDSTYREHVDPFMFYKDGTYGVFHFFHEYPFLKMRDLYLPGKIYSWYRDTPGGNYMIKGDTIIADAYCLLRSRWRLNRLKFKVVARDTLLLYECETDVSVKGKKTERYKCHQFYIFVPAKLPLSNFMPIRKKKWMWENQEEWQQNRDSMRLQYPENFI